MLNHGKIEGIFFSEFHLEKGPKIVSQVPQDTPNQVPLDDLHMYLIPKNFYRKIIRLNYTGQIIIGYPILLTGEEYERNVRRFNCCFLFNSSTDTSKYETIVRKLNLYLEQEVIYESFDKLNLTALLKEVYDNLNATGQCHYVGDNNSTLHLQVDVQSSKKVSINNTDVPIFTGVQADSISTMHFNQSDIVGQKILPLINGEKPVAQLARQADVELDVVKEYLKTFIHHGAISLVSLFQYSNVHITTPKMRLLYLNGDLQQRCLDFVSLPGKRASFTDVFKFYACLSFNRVDELCLRFNPHHRNIDERKLIQFGLLEGLVRKLDKFPVKENFDSHYYPMSSTQSSARKTLDSYLTGHNSYDDICDVTGLSHAELDERLESDSVTTCWK